MFRFFKKNKNAADDELPITESENGADTNADPAEAQENEHAVTTDTESDPLPISSDADNAEAERFNTKPDEVVARSETDKTAESPAQSAPQVIANEPALENPPTPDDGAESMPSHEDKSTRPGGFFTRLKQGLQKTRANFTESLASLVLGRKEIDDDLLDELEMILLSSDVGVEATDRIIQSLTDKVSRKALKDPAALVDALKESLQAILSPVAQPLVTVRPDNTNGPFVILMVGVNGVGKTTTIGKLAKQFQNEGKSVMLAAGDTFRAAAVEQLQTWGERNNVPVIAQKTGADSAAVIFDAIQSAHAKGVDIVIADTAGRLHTQSNLMEELKKVKRVIQKVDASAPHEIMLVLDAATGQNALSQAKLFNEAVGVTGLTVTKLDGTAKGGIVYALADQLGIPVRFIGVGESIDDLRPFNAKAFSEALFESSGNTQT